MNNFEFYVNVNARICSVWHHITFQCYLLWQSIIDKWKFVDNLRWIDVTCVWTWIFVFFFFVSVYLRATDPFSFNLGACHDIKNCWNLQLTPKKKDLIQPSHPMVKFTLLFLWNDFMHWTLFGAMVPSAPDTVSLWQDNCIRVDRILQKPFRSWMYTLVVI